MTDALREIDAHITVLAGRMKDQQEDIVTLASQAKGQEKIAGRATSYASATLLDRALSYHGLCLRYDELRLLREEIDPPPARRAVLALSAEGEDATNGQGE